MTELSNIRSLSSSVQFSQLSANRTDSQMKMLRAHTCKLQYFGLVPFLKECLKTQ